MIPERIANRIDVADCWEWTGALNASGYGIARTDGSTLVHRYIYETLVGPTPLPLDHLCRNRRCCNPDHLEPVTHGVNNHRSPIWNGNRATCASGHRLEPYSAAYPQRFCRTCHNARNRAAARRRRGLT